jgi:hypothetical protein
MISEPKMGVILRTGLTLLVGALCALDCPAADASTATPADWIGKVKEAEQTAGFHPTGNFRRTNARLRAYYRCYFTGLLDLPETYDGLKLRKGSQDGCALDAKKYDIFFYPIEEVASGHAPITQSLTEAPAERLVTVVSHEDFHEQIRSLPDPIAEAAATLAGFITGAAVLPGSENHPDADLFLRKAMLINRYYDRLRGVYNAVRRGQISKSAALRQKHEVFDALQQECSGIEPDPRSFNKCVAAPNNAGLAFDHTYTQYYPMVYQVLVACRRDLKCTIGALLHAPKKASAAALTAYFAKFSQAESSR